DRTRMRGDPVEAGEDLRKTRVALGVGHLHDDDARGRRDTDATAAAAGDLATGDERGEERAVAVAVEELSGRAGRATGGQVRHVDAVGDATGAAGQRRGVTHARVQQRDVYMGAGPGLAGRAAEQLGGEDAVAGARGLRRVTGDPTGTIRR